MEEVQDVNVPENKLIYPVRPIEQNETWACGPAALRIVLRYQFGLKLTENDLILLMGSTPSGSDEHNLTRALDILGFRYRQTENGTWNKLKACLADGQVPIVHLVMNDGGGHYMVLSGYDEDEQLVYLADPASGKIIKYGNPFFMGVWKVEENETQTRWFLAITGHGGDRLDSLMKRVKSIAKKVRNARK